MELSDIFYGINPSTHKTPFKILVKKFYKKWLLTSPGPPVQSTREMDHTLAIRKNTSCWKRKRSLYALNVSNYSLHCVSFRHYESN